MGDPQPPLCKGGKVGAAHTPERHLSKRRKGTGGERTGLVGRPPPPLAPPSQGGEARERQVRLRSALATALVGVRLRRALATALVGVRLRRALATSAGSSGLHPPWPPLCKGGNCAWGCWLVRCSAWRCCRAVAGWRGRMVHRRVRRRDALERTAQKGPVTLSVRVSPREPRLSDLVEMDVDRRSSARASRSNRRRSDRPWATF